METNKSLFLFIALACFTLSSCDDNKPKDSEKVADKANEVKTETNRSEEDAELLVNAVSSDYFELAAAEQANSMSTNASVKEFATMMMMEHKTIMEETRALAAKKGYTVPNSMSNDYTSKLQDMAKWKKGKEYDTKYMDDQLDHHQKMLDQLEKCMARTNDTDIKMWSQKAAAGVRKHTEMAKTIDTKLEQLYK
ncbi:MAG: DUF4142 domain-containing protein [Phycisphaerae bacterium]|nr:DUF4142 domain-containing protein [Saprospiraceae bacterium]